MYIYIYGDLRFFDGDVGILEAHLGTPFEHNAPHQPLCRTKFVTLLIFT